MQKFLLLFLCASSFTGLRAQSISPDSLVLHLPFDSNTLDVSGNNYNGTSANTIYSTGANGQANSAIQFDGSSSYVTIPNITQLDGQLTDYTILVRMWVATVDSLPNIPQPFIATYNFLCWHRNAADSGNAFLHSKFRMSLQGPVRSSPPNQAFLNYIGDWCTGNVATLSGYNKPQNEMVKKWMTFTLRYHRGTIDVYHNCEQVLHWQNIYPAVSDLCGTDPMQITLGLVPQAAFQYGYRYFNGKIDDLRVYRRALTDNEILMYTDSTCRKDPVPTLRIQVTTPDPCSPEKIGAKDISTLNGDSLISRKWRMDADSSSSDSISYPFTQAGTHHIQLEYVTKGGTYIKDTAITIRQLGRIHFLTVATNTLQLCQGATTRLEVKGGSSYQWLPCTSLDKCDAAQVTTSTRQNIRYKIMSSNREGCFDSTYIDVKVILDTAKVWVPTAFSPNGDGLNETFGLLHFSPIEQLQMEVYNRWGQNVFRKGVSTNYWDGKLNGTPQPAGQYNWLAQYNTGTGCPEKKLSGVVWLVR